MKPTSRRAFLGAGAKAASLFLVGCSTNARTLAGAESEGHADAGVELGGASDDGGQRCEHTRPDIEGPFFKPNSPARPTLLEGGEAGTRITIGGRIVDGACRPLAGAIVDFWQADDDGAYDDSASFLLRGHQMVGADGRYEVTTIIPGRYLNGSQYRPAHIHCKVYVGGTEVLTTQLYFEGDPFNEVDPWFSELTMLRPRDDGSGLRAIFDFSTSLS